MTDEEVIGEGLVTRSGAFTPEVAVTALVLAGGASRRFGSDKLAAPLAGTTVLDHLLVAIPAHWPVVAVGAERATARPVVWTHESPPGGGPLAGIAAGAQVVGTGLLVVVAGDMPWAASALPLLAAELTGAGPEVTAALARDGEGHVNPLLAAYRTQALRAFLPRPAHDRPAKTLFGMTHVILDVDPRAASDVDTRQDLARLDSRMPPPAGPPGPGAG